MIKLQNRFVWNLEWRQAIIQPLIDRLTLTLHKDYIFCIPKKSMVLWGFVKNRNLRLVINICYIFYDYYSCLFVFKESVKFVRNGRKITQIG